MQDYSTESGEFPKLTTIGMKMLIRSMSPKVIIADDSDFVRDGMRIILDIDDDGVMEILLEILKMILIIQIIKVKELLV